MQTKNTMVEYTRVDLAIRKYIAFAFIIYAEYCKYIMTNYTLSGKIKNVLCVLYHFIRMQFIVILNLYIRKYTVLYLYNLSHSGLQKMLEGVISPVGKKHVFKITCI